ncbi:hypothetical protein [Erythrobacter sp. YT30]|uniref:hypothetical protein n=1 Tax=Erythrobacter sp. YT30 TaxID=1735012 RepID=UPI00076CE6EA|nr:hypothetical protein [Erythrobacter sp. YT30]KWV91456.1 hypothetical protein AUC45_09385 [Erythrobacter sp. YT30]
MTAKGAGLVLLATALGACASGSGGVSPIRTSTDPRVATPAPVRTAPQPAPAANARQPSILREAGLEAIIGAQAPALTARFGKARIDLAEGDARKLQFVSETCVLDIYLYPVRNGDAQVATHVEARQRKSGAATSRSGCAADIARNPAR